MESNYWHSVTVGLNHIHFLPSFYCFYHGAFGINTVRGNFLPKMCLLIEAIGSDKSVNLSLSMDFSQSSSILMKKGR